MLITRRTKNFYQDKMRNKSATCSKGVPDRCFLARYKKFEHGTGSGNVLSMIAAYTTAFVQKIKSLYLP